MKLNRQGSGRPPLVPENTRRVGIHASLVAAEKQKRGVTNKNNICHENWRFRWEMLGDLQHPLLYLFEMGP